MVINWKIVVGKRGRGMKKIRQLYQWLRDMGLILQLVMLMLCILAAQSSLGSVTLPADVLYDCFQVSFIPTIIKLLCEIRNKQEDGE